MRAYININQKAFSELAILKSTKIDLIDATIFEYIVKFAVSNKANKQLIDNKLFTWCSYQKIIDDNPLLNINSKKAIELRLIKLIDLGLFEKFTDKKEGNKTYFNVTDLAYKLIIENISISNIHYQPLVTEITNLSNEDYQPLSNEDYQPLSNEDYYNSKLNNSKLNNSKLNKNEFSFTLSKLIQYDNLSQEYKDKLKEEINKLNLSIAYDDFVDSLIAKGYKYKNFLIAYKNWCKKDFNKDKANSNNTDDDEWSDGTTRCDPNEYR